MSIGEADYKVSNCLLEKDLGVNFITNFYYYVYMK